MEKLGSKSLCIYLSKSIAEYVYISLGSKKARNRELKAILIRETKSIENGLTKLKIPLNKNEAIVPIMLSIPNNIHDKLDKLCRIYPFSKKKLSELIITQVIMKKMKERGSEKE